VLQPGTAQRSCSSPKIRSRARRRCLLQCGLSSFVEPFAGYRFGGSETLDAFDDRHFPCRIDSGNAYPSRNARPTGQRFLHLLVVDELGQRETLLMPDLWGELFKDIAVGVNVANAFQSRPGPTRRSS